MTLFPGGEEAGAEEVLVAEEVPSEGSEVEGEGGWWEVMIRRTGAGHELSLRLLSVFVSEGASEDMAIPTYTLDASENQRSSCLSE